jgi:hypothetical protein
MSRSDKLLLLAAQLGVIAILGWLFAPKPPDRSTLERPVAALEWHDPPAQAGIVADTVGGIAGIRLRDGASYSPPSLTPRRLEGPFTIAMELVVERHPGADLPLFSRWDSKDGARSFQLGLRKGGRPYFVVSGDGRKNEQYREIEAKHPVPLDRPFHLVAVFSPDERMAMFVDGGRVAEVKGSKRVPDAAFPSRAPVVIGSTTVGSRWTASTYNDLRGVYGPLYVFDRALVDEDIATEAATLGYRRASEP